MIQRVWHTTPLLFRGITTQPPSEMFGWLHVTSRRFIAWNPADALSLSSNDGMSSHDFIQLDERGNEIVPPSSWDCDHSHHKSARPF
jgi:hypothetical protein